MAGLITSRRAWYGAEIEIAEAAVEFAAPHNGVFGLGIERLAMARSGKLLTWEQGEAAFRQMVEEEARQTRQPLPSGYFKMLGLAQPD